MLGADFKVFLANTSPFVYNLKKCGLLNVPPIIKV